jgi:hypothetical protein
MDNQRELTKEDIKALRTCDRVVVKIDGEITTVRCIKEVKAIDGFTSADPYTTLQAEYEISAQGHLSTRYRTASCFLSFTTSGAWGLLVKSLRVGDRIVFEARENGNGYINGVLSGKTSDIDNNIDFTSLHYDEMCLTIYRKGKVFADKVVFEHSICPSNSARMLQA